MSTEKIPPPTKVEPDLKSSANKKGPQPDDDSGTTNHKDQEYRRAKFFHSQGYDYQGEKPKIGVILALKNERFGNKVVFSVFVDKMKNHVLTHFTIGKDMVTQGPNC